MFFAASSKVLTKKEKKAQKRQLIMAQKLIGLWARQLYAYVPLVALNVYVVLKIKYTGKKTITKWRRIQGISFKGYISLKKILKVTKRKKLKRLFVGSLKYTATEESLREIFSSCGEIDYVRRIRNNDKGCKGVSYVCFTTPDAVVLALELNGTIVDDRHINVERFSVRKLGAKEARDVHSEKEKTSKKGAKQRLDG